MKAPATRSLSLVACLKPLNLIVLLLALLNSALCKDASSRDDTTPPPGAPKAEARLPKDGHLASPTTTLPAANQMLQAQGPVFIENRGQFDSRVKFLVTGNGANLWLTNEGIVFDFQRPMDKPSPDASTEKREPSKSLSPGRAPIDPRLKSDPPPMERLVFKQKLVSPNPNPTIEARDPQPGIYNYFPTSDPDTWRTHVLAYKEVVYRDVWKGIDLKLFANGPNLEEEFIVHPGADASAVRLAYEGIEGLSVADDGSLKVATAFGDIVETSPRIYQDIAGNTVPLSGSFKVGAQNSYTFEVAKRDEQSDLIIDPTVIYSKPRDSKRAPSGNPPLYSSFLGGSQYDIGNAIAVDNAGNAYITGQTNSTDFPTMGAFQGSGTGVFITKVNALGSAPLVYSTYLGQAARGFGIAVDSSGSAYAVGGYTNPNFPTTANAYDQAPCGAFGQGGSAFFTKLSPAGDALIYSTCLGQGAIAQAVAVDTAGNAYITGAAVQVPVTPGAFQSNPRPAFFTVFNPSASGAASLVYSTYFGGTQAAQGNPSDTGYGIAVDSYGMAYLTGLVTSIDFPVTSGAYWTTYPGNNNCTGGALTAVPCPSAFIAKFDPQASGVSSLLYSTYLGGINTTIGEGIAVDSLGNAYVGGHTGYDSLWGWCGPTCTPAFPTTQGAYQTVPDREDAFVTKLNAAGNNLIYSTLLGGNAGHAQTAATGIALDVSNDAYVTGWADSSNFPTTPNNAYLPTDPNPAFQQGFVTQFNSSGTRLLYSSYLGGTMQGTNGDGGGIAVDQVGDAYVTGNTYASDFPITQFPFQPLYAGNGDAFVTKFPIGTPSGISITGIAPNAGGNAGSVSPEIVGTGFHLGATAQLNCGGNPVTGQNVIITTGGRILDATFDLTTSAPGTCDVVVTNPDRTSARLAGGFTVQQGGTYNVQAYLTGAIAREAPYEQQTSPTDGVFFVTLTNTGNVDSGNVFVGQPVTAPFSLTSVSPPGITNFGSLAADSVAFWEVQNVGAGQNVQPLTSTTWTISPVLPPVSVTTCYYPQGTSYVNWTVFAGCVVDTHLWGTLGVSLACGNGIRQCIVSCVGTLGGGCITGCIFGLGLCAYVAWPLINTCLNDSSVPIPATCIRATFPISAPSDPNSLTGPPGVGTQQWVSGAQPLSYIIGFANDPSASAPAQQVFITQPLDPNVNPATLGLLTMTIPNDNGTSTTTVPVPVPLGSFNPGVGLNEFSTNVDLRPAQNLFVKIDVTLNPATQVLMWHFTSIDPTTGQPPINPLIGFLQPGTGGTVAFRVTPAAGLATGTQVSDQATIVFDVQPPMNTATWVNTLDNTPPTSQVTAFSGSQLCPNFTVQWSGADIGSGIANYTIYVSDNGGAFTAWQTNTTSTSAVYNGQVGHSYGFYSIAQDLVGNIEPGKSSAEATTYVVKDTGCGPIGPPTALGGQHGTR